jgi:hypothetical protein
MLDCIHIQQNPLPRDQVLVWGDSKTAFLECLNMSFINLSGETNGFSEMLFKNGDKRQNFTNCLFENLTSSNAVFNHCLSFLFLFLFLFFIFVLFLL